MLLCHVPLWCGNHAALENQELTSGSFCWNQPYYPMRPSNATNRPAETQGGLGGMSVWSPFSCFLPSLGPQGRFVVPLLLPIDLPGTKCRVLSFTATRKYILNYTLFAAVFSYLYPLDCSLSTEILHAVGLRKPIDLWDLSNLTFCQRATQIHVHDPATVKYF